MHDCSLLPLNYISACMLPYSCISSSMHAETGTKLYTRTGIHTHMGEPRDARDTCMGSPYAYGLPIRVWDTKNGPYAYGQPIRVWDSPYAYGKNTRMGRNSDTIMSSYTYECIMLQVHTYGNRLK